MPEKKRTPPQAALDSAIQHVLDGDDTPAPLVVNVPRNSRQIVEIKQQSLVTVRENIIRIQQVADPIGFMIAVQQGALFECIDVVERDGHKQQITHYEQASLKQRIEAAKFLTTKILPTLSVQQHIIEDSRDKTPPEERHALSGEPGQPSFAQIVAAAAAQAQRKAVEMAPDRVVLLVDEQSDNDGTPVYMDSAGAGLAYEEEDETLIVVIPEREDK
jgi:hypothetical protein